MPGIREEYREIPLEKLRVSPYNIRERFKEEDVERLARSIERHGLINPLTVMHNEEEDVYEIICGRLRFEAMKRLRERGKGPERVRVKVVYGLTPAEAVILSLSENWEQHSITEEEKGRALARLVEEYGYRPEQLAESLARSVREIEGLLSIIGLGRVATRGRPRKEERAERINPDAGILAQNLTEYLMKEGVVEEAEKEEFEEELLETVKGLPGQSVRKVFKTVKQRVAEEKKERGEIPSKEEVREIAKEVAEKERRKVSRVVLLDVEVVRAVNAYAKSLQTDFNEALETLARERLSQLGYL